MVLIVSCDVFNKSCLFYCKYKWNEARKCSHKGKSSVDVLRRNAPRRKSERFVQDATPITGHVICVGDLVTLSEIGCTMSGTGSSDTHLFSSFKQNFIDISFKIHLQIFLFPHLYNLLLWQVTFKFKSTFFCPSPWSYMVSSFSNQTLFVTCFN